MNRQSLLTIALLVSLAVNLLVAGVVLGHLRDPKPMPPPLAWATSSLKPETQQLVRRQMRSQLPKVKPLRQDMRRAIQSVRLAAGTEPYDPVAMDQALNGMREVTHRYQELIHENVVELAAELPAEERLALLRSALQRLQMSGIPPGARPPEGFRRREMDSAVPRAGSDS